MSNPTGKKEGCCPKCAGDVDDISQTNPYTCQETRCPCHTKKEDNKRMIGNLASTGVGKLLPKKEDWEQDFDKEFGDLTLGILSGGKGSPVFVNNELEVPRLKNFIHRQREEAAREERKRILALLPKYMMMPEDSGKTRVEASLLDRICAAITKE